MWRVPFVFLFASVAVAQGPDPTFLKSWALTRGFQLGRPTRALPTPDGKSVLFLRATARDPAQSLYEFDVASRQTRELLTPQSLLHGAEEKLSAAEKSRRERQRVTARGFTHFELSDDGKRLLVGLSGRLYLVERPGGAVQELPTSGAFVDARLSPDGKHVAFVRERDLWVLDFDSMKERRLTHSDSPTRSNGVAEFVAQEEMDRASGYWWSGDSRQLAYEEAEARGVGTLNVFDVVHPERAGEPTFYPRAGQDNVKVRLGVIAVGGGATRWLPWDVARFPYLAHVEWRDRAPLTFTVVSRDQHDLELYAVVDWRPRRLLAEHDDAWLNLDPSLPRWLPDGSAFLWSSEREGHWRLELRGRDGAKIRPLSALADGYAALVDLAPDQKTVHFQGGADALGLGLYVTPLDGGAAVELTHEPGLHQAVIGRDHSTWVDRVTTASGLPRSLVYVGSQLIGELPSVAEAPPSAATTTIERVGPDQIAAAVTRPRHFDAKRPYPVVVAVYGGPHAQMVQYKPQLFWQWLADHGIVVVAFDGHGTPRRGRDWERAIAGDFSRTLDDQVTALRLLGAAHAELDLSRVGVYGWSFGGYLAALAVLERPEVFHVAVAGAPVVDWTDYDTFYTERYLGLPAANAAGYRKSSLLSRAQKLSRPLLLIHGTADDNVYFFNTLKLCDALFRAGKPFSLLPLVGLTHMVPDPIVTEQLWTRVAAHLMATLAP